MLGKVLGVTAAGVFVGAAVFEVLRSLDGDRAGKDPLPLPATDRDAEAAKEHEQTAPCPEG